MFMQALYSSSASMQALPQSARASTDADGSMGGDELHPLLEDRLREIERTLQFCVTSSCNLNDRLYAAERQHAELRDQVSQISALRIVSDFEGRVSTLEQWVPWLTKVWKWWFNR